MMSVYALGRLFWRPAALVLLFPALLAGAAPFLWPESPTMTLWRENLVAVLAGFICSMAVAEMKRGLFTWTLPRIDGLFVRGFAIASTVISLPLAVTSAMLLGAEFGIASLGAGILFFALGTEINNRVSSNNCRRAILAFLAFLFWRPDYMHRVALLSPVAFGIVAAGLAYLIFRRAGSPDSARARPFVGDPLLGHMNADALRNFWSKKEVKRREWTKPLLNGSTTDWIFAVYHETINTRSGGWARYANVSVIIGGVMAYALNGPWFVAMQGSQAVMYGGLQLRTNLNYPLSRDQRARIFYLTCLIENAYITGASAILMVVLYTFGPGHLTGIASNREEVSPLIAAAYAMMMFVFMPVTQWAKIQGPLTPQGGFSQSRGMVKAFGLAMVFVMLQVSVATPLLAIKIFSPSVALLFVALATVAIQGMFWLLIRRHYRRADIVLRGNS